MQLSKRQQSINFDIYHAPFANGCITPSSRPRLLDAFTLQQTFNLERGPEYFD